MADKANTLPRSKKSGFAFSVSPKLRKSAKHLLPSLPTLRKSNLSLLSGKSDESSYRDTIDSCSIHSTSPSATPTASPSSSPSSSKSRRFSLFSKSSKDEKVASQKKSKKSKKTLKKTLSKGSKLILPKFSFKDDSSPFMVETDGELRRTSCVDDNLLTVKHEEAVSDDDSLKAESCHSGEVFEGEWSFSDTCERVRKLSASGIRCSIYDDSETAPIKVGDEVEGSSDLLDPETFSNMSNSSPRSVESKNTNGQDTYFNFGKKSPSTLRKEIMKITDSQLSEGNQYIAAKLERRRSSSVSTCDRCLLLFNGTYRLTKVVLGESEGSGEGSEW